MADDIGHRCPSCFVRTKLRLASPEIFFCPYKLLLEGKREIRIVSSFQKQF